MDSPLNASRGRYKSYTMLLLTCRLVACIERMLSRFDLSRVLFVARMPPPTWPATALCLQITLPYPHAAPTLPPRCAHPTPTLPSVLCSAPRGAWEDDRARQRKGRRRRRR